MHRVVEIYIISVTWNVIMLFVSKEMQDALFSYLLAGIFALPPRDLLVSLLLHVVVHFIVVFYHVHFYNNMLTYESHTNENSLWSRFYNMIY